MKKIYTTPAYKKSQQKKMRRALKQTRKKNNRENDIYKIPKNYTIPQILHDVIKPAVYAPKDFRLTYNTEECLNFFNKLRSINHVSKFKNREYVEMDLSNVINIDYSTISILTALNDDFKDRRIVLRGNFPDDDDAKQYLIDSGFLNSMYNENGRPYPKTKQSDLLIFEKGSNIFERKYNQNISNVISNISLYLTGIKSHNPRLKTILLEIFANSIEWSETINKQWLLGVKYDQDRVILTITDVGKGIIRTLHKKFDQKFFDILQLKSNDEVLLGAFEKKYASSSKKPNRNKGLPSIKNGFDKGVIKELKVITNNVILHFDDKKKTRTVRKGTSWFKGTLYRCVITKECIN